MNTTTQKESGGAPDRPEELDIKGALTRLGGRKELYEKVLKKFVPECSRAHETISRQLADGDMEAASRTAHTVKGASGTIGATVLSRAAEDVEKQIKNRQKDLAPYLKRFNEVMNNTLKMISEYLENEAVGLPVKPDRNKNAPVTDKAIERSLEELMDYLKSGDMRALNVWEHLKWHFEGTVADPMISDFDRAMDLLDFDSASEILTMLMKDLDQRKAGDDPSKHAQSQDPNRR